METVFMWSQHERMVLRDLLDELYAIVPPASARCRPPHQR